MYTHYLNRLFLVLLSCCCAALTTQAQQIDLSLTASQSDVTPVRYDFYTVTVSVANAGPANATGVSVAIPKPTGVVYEGGNEFAATQGRLTTSGANTGRWTVGALAPGASASITVRYYLLDAEAPYSYAEVRAADQPDTDSTPANGNGRVSEDDEASTDPEAGVAAGIDLSLAIERSTGMPARYSTYSVTATVANAGPLPATGVAVEVPLPAGVVYEGGNEFSASQGTLLTFGARNGRWTVGTLAAGASATLRVNYYLLAPTAPESYAEVVAANEADGDSSPGNGDGQVREDDEASTASAQPPVCALAPAATGVACDDNGTADDPSDDTFSAEIAVSATDRGGSNFYTLSYRGLASPLRLAYDTRATVALGAIAAAGEELALTVTDELTPTCTATFTVAPPAACSSGNGGGDDIACTFEQSATGEGFDLRPSRAISIDETDAGYTLNVDRGFEFATNPFRRTTKELATYTFAADGTQLTTVPAVTTIDYRTSVDVDFSEFKLVATDSTGNTTEATFADPFPADAVGTYAGGFAERLPDGSGYLVFVRRIVNSGSRDSTLLSSFVVDNDLMQVSGVSDYGLRVGRFEGAAFIQRSARGGYFLRVIERGTNNTFVLLDAEYRPLGDVSLGVNGRFDQPFEFHDLPDGTFAIASYFDGAQARFANTISRYSPSGELVSEYASSRNEEGRDLFQALIRPDGGFVGVARLGQNGTDVEVRNGNGALLATTFLDGLFDVDLLGLSADTSIFALASRDSTNGPRVFLKLTRLGALDCDTPTPDGPAGVDLELTATSAQQRPSIYTANALTFTLTNAGTETATGVMVRVPKPTDVVYSGGNEFTASQGRLSTFGANRGTWRVGELAAGATATLVVNYYALGANGYTQFAEVTALAEIDLDSAPGNGTGSSASEDDEVYLDLSYGTSAALRLSPNQVAVGQRTTLDYVSEVDANHELILTDVNGRTILRTRVQLLAGENRLPVNVSGLPTGIYVAALPGSGLRPARLFVR